MNIIIPPHGFQAQHVILASATILVIKENVQRSLGQINGLVEKTWRVR